MTLPISPTTPVDVAVSIVREWLEAEVPEPWRRAAAAGRPVKEVRTFADYEAWYPVFAGSGLVVPTWPVAYGGLDLAPGVARRLEQELAPLSLGRLNPLGLNLCAPALFAYGTEEQRLRFLPRIVDNRERWCQLFSEPGAGSDLAALSTRAERDGDEWSITGQKVWTTWAHISDWAVCLARTDPSVPKRRGITYFLVDLHAAGVDVRPLRHITGEVDFNEVFLEGVRVPDRQRVGDVGDGWRVANATLSGERQMVSGAGSGGVDRIGGGGADQLLTSTAAHLTTSAADPLTSAGDPLTSAADPLTRQRVVSLWAEERIRGYTNARVRAGLKAGRSPGPESSIGKVHQGALNQRIQLAACDLAGVASTAWPGDRLPADVKGMLRSRANTIEGGTTEVNKNVIGERVLGLPREPDPYQDAAWQDIPRS
jgi:alkylation response protein AidB-like acyl-CoA dehydrogenase